MNTRFLLAVALAALPLSPVIAQVAQQPPLISVSGSAEVKVAPDEIHLSVGVETRHENLAEAKRQNDDGVSRALAFLKKSGVPAKDVQTDYISVEPSYNDSSRTQPLYYIVRKSIEIKLTDITTFENTLTGLLTNGVNQVHGIDFRTTELRKYRDQARAMALRAAREKADALVAELGVKRGKVYTINANDGGGWGGYYGGYWGGRGGGGMFQNAAQSVGGGSDSTGDTMSVGQISISASVNVSFLIQ
jgi:uncharacterized protein YggE